uniref:Conotoxin-like unassigned superfamily 11 n=1 Tax=Conus ermineus TaxID=55423 RepID=A0A346CJ52_CONER|nr:conotoxin-like precursor unassigned superfamily 11 [Conus ermineus]
MEFRRLVTVGLLLTLVMSTDSAPVDQTETGKVSLRQDEGFPCNSGQCACVPKGQTSFECLTPPVNIALCRSYECKWESEWGK